MDVIQLDPVFIEIGLPALAAGVLLGLGIMWLVTRRREKALQQDLDNVQASLKHQEALDDERKAAFELANARLTEAFSDISNRSLRANSDTFLQLARQNLETHQEKARSELSEREKAVEALVKPVAILAGQLGCGDQFDAVFLELFQKRQPALVLFAHQVSGSLADAFKLFSRRQTIL